MGNAQDAANIAVQRTHLAFEEIHHPGANHLQRLRAIALRHIPPRILEKTPQVLVRIRTSLVANTFVASEVHLAETSVNDRRRARSAIGDELRGVPRTLVRARVDSVEPDAGGDEPLRGRLRHAYALPRQVGVWYGTLKDFGAIPRRLPVPHEEDVDGGIGVQRHRRREQKRREQASRRGHRDEHCGHQSFHGAFPFCVVIHKPFSWRLRSVPRSLKTSSII